MKQILILLAFLPFCAGAQNLNDNRYEHALYEILQLNRSASTTIVSVEEVAFTEREYDAIVRAIQEKEELFKVELIDQNRSLKFYHFDTVGADEIKTYVLPYKDKVEISEPTPFNP